MSDIVRNAKNARESLALGLGSLQGDSALAADVLALAEPIAKAMGSLHDLETASTDEVRGKAELSLLLVREALGKMQLIADPPSVVVDAMGSVASALSMVNQIARQSLVPAAAPAVSAAPPPPVGVKTEMTTVSAEEIAVLEANAPGRSGAPPRPSKAAPAVTAPAPAEVVVVVEAAPVVSDSFVAAAAAPAVEAPLAPAVEAPVVAASAAEAPSKAATSAGGVVRAELGVRSDSNFYKGLSGNDVVDHGGLFVATYVIPKVGTSIRLVVTMPGGYEFDVPAVVAWVREAGSTSQAPGFGARMSELNQENRGLIQRYVKNREPMFYDDL